MNSTVLRVKSSWPFLSTTLNTQLRFLHSSVPVSAGRNWRKAEGLPENPNAYGPLTDLPDYTFLDGRRTPAGAGKLRRAQEQELLAEKIMKLSSEIDFAIDRRKQLDIEEEQGRQSILDRKLKPKGEDFGPKSSKPRRSPRKDAD